MSRRSAVIGLFLMVVLAGCGKDARELLEESTPVRSDVCRPDSGSFTLEIDNPFLPLTPGNVLVLEGRDGGREARVEITVVDETETIAGIVTRVVEEREWIDGEVVEISRNFMVQAGDGSVCYYGEEVDDYRGGELVGHGGAWRAGQNGALPGILMPADPIVGTSHQQEIAPGVAEDTAVVVELGRTVTVPAGTFSDTLVTRDVDPIGGGIDEKVYVRGIGLVVDESLQLTGFGE